MTKSFHIQRYFRSLSQFIILLLPLSLSHRHTHTSIHTRMRVHPQYMYNTPKFTKDTKLEQNNLLPRQRMHVFYMVDIHRKYHADVFNSQESLMIYKLWLSALIMLLCLVMRILSVYRGVCGLIQREIDREQHGGDRKTLTINA